MTLEACARYRASTGQEAIWIAERLSPAAGAYVEALAWRLTPAPDPERLGAALTALIARHEVLRTRLVEEDSELWQFVRAPHAAVHPLLVTSGWTPSDLARWLRAPIDPANGLPLRAALILQNEDALLGLALHHAMVDSWALDGLLKEWSDTYNAGAAPESRSPATQYGPWADAEREEPAPPVPDEIVTLLRRDAVTITAPPSSPKGAPVEAAPEPVAAAETLRRAARRRRVTTFELITCAATRAFRTEVGPSDAVLGTVMSRRDSAAAQRMLGYCAAVVPIPCPDSVDLDSVAHGIRLARQIRHVPPTALVARVGRRNAPGRQPLFDAVLAYERGTHPAPTLAGVAAVPIPVPVAAAKFSFALAAREDDATIRVGAEWTAGAVPSDAAARVLGRIAMELEELCADPTPVRRTAFAAPATNAPSGPAPGGAGTPPRGDVPSWRDGLELDVAAAWEEVLGHPPKAIEENFFEVGGDSLAAIHLCASITRRGLPRIEPARLVESATVPGIAGAIRAAASTQADPCLVRLRSGEGRAILLIHPVGGTVTWYAPLARLLRHPGPIWALQARGLTPGQAFHRSIVDMAADYAARVVRRLDEPPLAVGGYSMGGTVAAEVAGCLAREGRGADVLVLLDTTARPRRGGRDPHYAVRVLVEKALRLRFDWRAIADAPRREQARKILEAARAAGRLPADYDTERLRRMIEIYEHNSRALAYHDPAPYDGRAVLVRTDSEEAADDPTLGWGKLLDKLEIQIAPGDHFTLLDPENAPAVARLIEDALAAAVVGDE